VEFRLLGEVGLRAAGQLLDVGPPRQQAELMALAVDAGRPVAIGRLIDRLWADASPAAVRNVLYSHVSRIRRLLMQASTLAGEKAVRIERRHTGYVLDVEPDLVDLHRFRWLVEQGRDARRTRSHIGTQIPSVASLTR
jgi:DNA-binding SARP family transcriptional activator